MEKKMVIFYGLNCGHQFCSKCWEEYLKEKLKSSLGALKVKCPQHECTYIIGEDVVVGEHLKLLQLLAQS